MSREITFRAWDGKSRMSYMVNVYCDGDSPGCWWVADYIDPDSGDKVGSFDGESDGEIMQYTGLKDKNGKEIYEGDIIVCKSYPFYGDAPEIEASSGQCQELNYIGIVEWFDDEASFYVGLQVVSGRVRGAACGGAISEYIDRAEVIGNIYENPDLLEQSAA